MIKKVFSIIGVKNKKERLVLFFWVFLCLFERVYDDGGCWLV